MELKEQKRKSGIEVLKLIAMLMIVISHTGPYYGDVYAQSFVNLRVATTNVQNLFLIFYIYLGQLGNAIFLVCSFYFLMEQNTVKVKKVLYILFDCLFFSLAFLGVFVCAGFEIPKMVMLKQFFPTTFEFCWFVGCYLLLYIIHPMLNQIIDKMSQKALFWMCLIGVILYSVGQMLIRDSFYYTRFIGFVLFYFLMAYSKKYLRKTSEKKKLNVIVLILSSVGLIALILGVNALGLYTDTFKEKMLEYCIFVNPFMILIAFSAFHICKDMKIQSKVINMVASVTLYIYIIHENYLFATYARPMVFAYIYEKFSYEAVALWALAFAGVCYVASLLIGLLYKYTLGKLIHKLCDKLAVKLSVFSEQGFEKFKKWN